MQDLPQVMDVLRRMHERVDRVSTRDVVLEELEAGRTLPTFVTAMVWGYGTTGYGPVRTRWVLTGIKTKPLESPILPYLSERLEAGVTAVRRNGPLAAFRLMNNEGKIKYLGSAFFTKWLYFTSALQSPDDAKAAPILDKQVSDWLFAHAGLSLVPDRTTSYERYLELLDAWSHQHNRTAVRIEKAIFGLATRRG